MPPPRERRPRAQHNPQRIACYLRIQYRRMLCCPPCNGSALPRRHHHAERCGRVLLLHQGRLLSDAPPAEFLKPLRDRVFRMVVAPGQRRAIARHAAAHPAVLDAQVAGDTLRIVLRAGAALPGAEALGGSALEPVAPRFEDGFIARLAAEPRTDDQPPPARLAGGGWREAAPAVPGDSPTTPQPARARAGPGGSPPGAETTDPPIIVHDLVRRFGSFTAVDHVSFSVQRGEIFGLLGPNGAGKSTTFRMLCGLLPPSGGTARVAGLDLLRAPAAARARLGYMAQRFSLYAELSVRENLTFFARVYGLSRAARLRAIDAALTQFELASLANTVARDLPLGLKQRLALAAALLHGPAILFLDEPTSGVDPLTRRDFWSRIGALSDAGVTILVTSHFMDEAEYCDRLGIVSQGRLAAVDTPAALRARVRTPEMPEPTLEDAFIALVQQATQQEQAA